MKQQVKQKKPPPNCPEGVDGERVELRANRLRTGTITHVSPMMWITVSWDDGHQAPKICHQYELMVVPIDVEQKTVV